MPNPKEVATPPADWPLAFFDDDYLRIYRPLLTDEVTRREADFIEAALEIPPGSEVLDLACGYGRHAVAIAARGHRVTGIDTNPRYIDLGTQAAADAGVTVQWRVADMRALEDVASYVGVYSYYTSFGYFSDVENEQVVARIAQALQPGGRFLLDTMNRDSMVVQPQQRTWMSRDDGGILLEEMTHDILTSRIRSRQILVEPQGGRQIVKEFYLRAYTCAELTALFARHGLVVDRVLGGPDGMRYSAFSRRLIVRATRVRN